MAALHIRHDPQDKCPAPRWNRAPRLKESKGEPVARRGPFRPRTRLLAETKNPSARPQRDGHPTWGNSRAGRGGWRQSPLDPKRVCQPRRNKLTHWSCRWSTTSVPPRRQRHRPHASRTTTSSFPTSMPAVEPLVLSSSHNGNGPPPSEGDGPRSFDPPKSVQPSRTPAADMMRPEIQRSVKANPRSSALSFRVRSSARRSKAAPASMNLQDGAAHVLRIN